MQSSCEHGEQCIHPIRGNDQGHDAPRRCVAVIEESDFERLGDRCSKARDRCQDDDQTGAHLAQDLLTFFPPDSPPRNIPTPMLDSSDMVIRDMIIPRV